MGPTPARRARVLAPLLLLALPSPAQSQGASAPRTHPWPPDARAADCDRRLAEALARLEQAVHLTLIPVPIPDAGRRSELLVSSARRHLRIHGSRCPGDPRFPYLRAMALRLRPTRTIERETLRRAAIEDLRESLRRDPAFQAGRIAFELGILYSLQGEQERASEAFSRSIRMARPPGLASPPVGTVPTLLAEQLFGPVSVTLARYNLADTLVSRPGRVEEALALFRTVRDTLDRGTAPSTRRLARWGEVLALHRLGRRHEALGAARALLEANEGREELPRGDGVFFAPPYERDHYEALLHLAASRDPRRPRPTRCRSLRAAEEHFHRYLERARVQGPLPWRETIETELQTISESARRMECPSP